MAITLTRGAQTLELPESLIWGDELAWVPVSQKADYSIEGALVIERFVRQAGRPITLEGQTGRAWIARGTLRTLLAWAADPAETVMTLTLRGVDYRVIFDLAEGSAVSGEAVISWADPHDADDYTAIKLKFMEV